ASPCATILKAGSLLSAGATLNLCAGACDGTGTGVFTESIYDDQNQPAISMHPQYGTDWDHPITIRAYPGEKITLRNSGRQLVYLSPPISRLPSPPNLYLIIDGLIFDGSQINANTQLWMFEFSGSHIRFINNEVMNMPDGSGGLIGGDHHE